MEIEVKKGKEKWVNRISKMIIVQHFFLHIQQQEKIIVKLLSSDFCVYFKKENTISSEGLMHKPLHNPGGMIYLHVSLLHLRVLNMNFHWST
jgi:hypothetical protein